MSVLGLYREWKTWYRSNLGSTIFMEPLGGQALGVDEAGHSVLVPQYVFLRAPTVIRPFDADHELEVFGDLYPKVPGDPLIQAVPGRTITVRMQVSAKAQLKEINTGSGLSEGQSQVLSDVGARVQEAWRLMGLDSDNPVILSKDGSGVVRLLIGALGSLLDQTMTPTLDGQGELQSLEIARQP